MNEPTRLLLPPAHESLAMSTAEAKRIDAAPAFAPGRISDPGDLRRQLDEARQAWLARSPSFETRDGYTRELDQFLRFANIPCGAWDELARVRPSLVAA